MDTNFSNELKYVLDQSRIEATRHNSSMIKAEHLLLAIMSKNESHAFQTLQKLLSADMMYQLRDALDNSLYEQPDSTEMLTVSDLANRIIKLSVLEARMLKSNIVDSEHLLLAIFHNSEVQNLEIMGMFRDAGVTYEALYRLLANVADALKWVHRSPMMTTMTRKNPSAATVPRPRSARHRRQNAGMTHRSSTNLAMT